MTTRSPSSAPMTPTGVSNPPAPQSASTTAPKSSAASQPCNTSTTSRSQSPPVVPVEAADDGAVSSATTPFA
ncbi:hypothetical protein C9J85_07375 [Haloferax sp. wsp5]|nr:hypothetical protein C9J85_07375 [Haloferax sp. wsp5]